MRKLTLVFALLIVSLTGAQDTAAPTDFMRAMALVPNAPFVRDSAPMVSYADYHAAIKARDIAVPENWAAFEAGMEPSLQALPPAGPADFLQTLLDGGPEYPALLGFDFFDIEQGLEVGQPPSMGQILLGEFDPEAVVAAYTARGFTVERQDEAGALLCPADGCDSGTKTNLRDRNPANPFGGKLGRSEPAFVGDGVFLNSPDLGTLESLIEGYSGGASTLADLPEFQAVGAALADYRQVSAVMVFGPEDFTGVDPRLALDQPEVAEALMAGFEAEPLPLFMLAAFASAADRMSEYGLAILAYTSAESAHTAAAVIDSRMGLLSMRTRTPYAEVYGAAGTLEPAQVIEDAASGMSVVVLRIVGDLVPNEPVDGRMVFSHRPFQRFQQSVFSRDTLWLVWGLETD